MKKAYLSLIFILFFVLDNSVFSRVWANYQVNPHVFINPDCGLAGTSFSIEWTGFTPLSWLTAYFKGPKGKELPTLRSFTDNRGRASYVLDSHLLSPGIYQHWAVDEKTKIQSDVVSFDIFLNPGFNPINFGKSVSFSMGFREKTLFGFCGKAGDFVSIRLVSNDWMEIQLVDIISLLTGIPWANSKGDSQTPARIDFFLPINNLYLAVVSHTGFRKQPIMGLSIQKIRKPGFASSLECGGISVGYLGFGERHTYLFKGNPGDKIALIMTPGPGEVNPFIEAFDSNGLVGVNTGQNFALLNNIFLKEGELIILASDSNNQTGFYKIELRCE